MPIAMDGALWMDGSTVSLQLVAPSGLLYSVELPLVVLMAQLDDGEIVRFVYDRTDPETGVTHSGAARLVLQTLTDPRETEEQPPAADATVSTSNCMQRAEQHSPHAWSVNEHTYQCDGASAYEGRPSRGIVGAALKQLGVEPYDYRGGSRPFPGFPRGDNSDAPCHRGHGGSPLLPPYTPPAR